MNSKRKKPGPPELPTGTLLFWESEWYWIFQGLAFGRPARNEPHTSWEPLPHPMLFAWRPANQRPVGYERLDRQIVRNWEAKPLKARFRQVTRRIKRAAIPAEPLVWNQLIIASTTSEIRAAVDGSAFWLNARENGRPYTTVVKEKADEFLRCKQYRYPQSDRPSSEIKRVIHFTRAMAGIMADVSPATAIDRFRFLKHGKRCPCVLCSIVRKKKLDKALYALLHSR